MIRIAQPIIGPEEEEAVLAVLRSGRLAQGERVAAFEAAFASYIGVTHAVAVSSGTAALYVALRAHGIGQGDEVLVPGFTFAATGNAVLLAGAQPVLADITAADFTLDPALLDAAVTARTKAVLPVHLYGHPADMAAIAAVADRRGLAVIEDAAQALGASIDGRKAGSFGTGCFSFYATKSITTGEGGMITTNDADIARLARLLRDHGEGERYRTDLLGGNFRMTELAAALGHAQLPKLDGWNERRRANAAWLSERLQGVVAPVERPGARHVYQQYTVRVPDARDALRDALRARDIEAVVYYERALHQQPLYQQLGIGGVLPESERAAAEVLSLPVHPSLSEDDLECIATAVNEARAPAGARRG
ncbi:MAG: DegT/DnrJ/EryC1/StrS aminotransferase family protein [Dehalococcoidia bacterium]